jgi:hypothetical protein
VFPSACAAHADYLGLRWFLVFSGGPVVSHVSLSFDVELLRPLIAAVVAETIAQLDADRAKLGDRAAFSEGEAAALLGLRIHQLRDERRRKRIGHGMGPGGRILYTRNDLLDYLARRRVEAVGIDHGGARDRRNGQLDQDRATKRPLPAKG